MPHSEHHVETLRESGGRAIESSHFLRFTQTVEGLERQYVAVAFDLQALPNVCSFDSDKPLSEQYRIVSAAPGSVAVFFTATKETSGFRFHLHAPFVPELSRASVKDTPVNTPLFRQLAELSARSLFTIRDLGLLTADFLAVLPNPNDDLAARYNCIRAAVVAAMNEQPLTPTFTRSHAPAKHLLQGPGTQKALLDEKDLEFLVDFEDSPPVWSIAAAQRNSNIDRFLGGLSIDEWGVEEFVQVLEEGLNSDGRYDDEFGDWIEGPDATFITWLRSKPDAWHQTLYAMLYRELEPEDKMYRVLDLCIVRISSGAYKNGNECFFPTEEVGEDPMLPRVAEGTYTSGRGKTEQTRARKFLEKVGVREVGEYEQIEAILKQRYTRGAKAPSKGVHERDLRRFISLVQGSPRTVAMFSNYQVLEREDGKWACPAKSIWILRTPIPDCMRFTAGRAIMGTTGARWRWRIDISRSAFHGRHLQDSRRRWVHARGWPLNTSQRISIAILTCFSRTTTDTVYVGLTLQKTPTGPSRNLRWCWKTPARLSHGWYGLRWLAQVRAT